MDSPIPLGSIVVGLDGSADAGRALDWGTDEAALEGRVLVLAHAVQPWGFPALGTVNGGGEYAALVDDLRTAGRAVIAEARRRVEERRPGLEVVELLGSSDPRALLLDASRRASLVVVGSRGRGPVHRLLLGSVSLSVSKHAACPVVVCRPPSRSRSGAPTRGILAEVGVTEESLPVAELAFRVAALRGRPLTALHCYWDAVGVAGRPVPDAAVVRAKVTESLAGLTDRFPDVHVDVQLAYGVADRKLVAASADHELLVIGHHPTGHLAELVYGSLASAVVEHAHCTVAVVPVGAARATAAGGT
jgi:nucleotide-binding universal stress UspA family protein